MRKSIELRLIEGTFIEECVFTLGEITVHTLNFGARLHKIFTPDAWGNRENIMLSYDNYGELLHDPACFGALVGPVAGRIARGEWGSIQLEQNEHSNNLHSGKNGWHKQYWQSEILEDCDYIGVRYFLLDQGNTGIPGVIKAEVSYTLDNNGTLTMTINGQVRGNDTLFNPTNHGYFNLSGKTNTILDHYLQVNADNILVTDEENIPTGDKLNVMNTPYDFRENRQLGDSLSELTNGIDDYFVCGKDSKLILSEQTSGRSMVVTTTASGFVLYSATGMNEDFLINGAAMSSERGLAIEAQDHPDAVNHSDFPDIMLYNGKPREQITTYQFIK